MHKEVLNYGSINTDIGDGELYRSQLTRAVRFALGTSDKVHPGVLFALQTKHDIWAIRAQIESEQEAELALEQMNDIGQNSTAPDTRHVSRADVEQGEAVARPVEEATPLSQQSQADTDNGAAKAMLRRSVRLRPTENASTPEPQSAVQASRQERDSPKKRRRV
ncbi:hypothetical protein HYPSUDRAFT_54380 [Hypholoma sublateritium FD-334 SS-4]|uniref:Uncharacterized protein n=1 Tax=Hypholoma sublateritium (strain FD-334 SS-4) TaxID=945553 RepID=A0A0D2MIF0_HYPSF|nr:hypothetical protein HYPSUDRAFT_54380 [Hypholoma sublateritium FD-334 SS-4]